ncbi:MAG TPA: DUF4253 domain-containing protein [Pirellulales bacterium]|nr:DUF4253 domain-containing protein [Pirellulales bacterium]
MRRLLALIVSVIAPGCSTQPAPPVGKAMNLEEAATRLVRISGKSIRPFATRDFGREKNPDARSALVREADARRVLDDLRRELGPGLLAFIGCTRSLADPPDKGSEIVVAAGDDQFEILRVAQSDAVNFDMETEDLVRKLQEYDAKYGIDIFHAETDTIEFAFRSMPDDLSAFCQDLYEFCPDIVDQGVGTVEKLEQEVARTKAVFLWWD